MSVRKVLPKLRRGRRDGATLPIYEPCLLGPSCAAAVPSGLRGPAPQHICGRPRAPGATAVAVWRQAGRPGSDKPVP